MSNRNHFPDPPDVSERNRALDTRSSVLVQAPAGSGKTTLLTERFLKLLSEVDDPRHIVAITFTNAAAAEMQNRILDELRSAQPSEIAFGALQRSKELGWQLDEVHSQLRIATIDSFCRELALRQPILTQLSHDLIVAENPEDLYRLAARRSLEQVDSGDGNVSRAVRSILQWRDNNWQEMEEQLVVMLRQRDRWMHGWVLARDSDWEMLRRSLEQPFQRAIVQEISELKRILDADSQVVGELLSLARFACETRGDNSPVALADCFELPAPTFDETLSDTLRVYETLADFLLTKTGAFRSAKGLKTADGFPKSDAAAKAKVRFSEVAEKLSEIPELQAKLVSVRELPPPRYSDAEWGIVQACFTVLRHATAELRVLFAEQGVVDFTEIAQAAATGLEEQDGEPTEAALAIADEIHHFLVDEFQDTSRRQHELLSKIIRAWPERDFRTCFIVGDPMQSIYFFRDADAELFTRVKSLGIETQEDDSLLLEFASLSANFRTEPQLVAWHNDAFLRVFAAVAQDDVPFNTAQAVRDEHDGLQPRFTLHLDFVPQRGRADGPDESQISVRNTAAAAQVEEIVALIRQHLPKVAEAKNKGQKYRVALLARTKKALAPIAVALRQASIPFRALDLEELKDRQEVLDALALARAWMNPFDRVAWLGVLRAPWCGLTLADLHLLTSADDPDLLERAIPELIRERKGFISEDGRNRLERIEACFAGRTEPQSAALGRWVESVWREVGGEWCVDAGARGNLELLWQCLDGLPHGRLDLAGPALDSALKALKAQPDPNASSDCGVQLMTIHKSKGLEFEVVVVPELQAAEGRGKPTMLSWLERGVSEQSEPGETTEFLVAPFQTKGSGKSRAKAWVDRVRSERERRELKRLLYVAATRARDELHFFARPGYRSADGELELVKPTNCLLAVAWPALEEETQQRFDAWKGSTGEHAVVDLAAEGVSNLIEMSVQQQGTRMRRLPLEAFQNVSADRAARGLGQAGEIGTSAPLFERHEGGVMSRTLGTAIHSLLQELARLRAESDWDEALRSLASSLPRVVAQIRSAGFERPTAGKLAVEALEAVRAASKDPVGQWLLSPHPDAASEAAWTGVLQGKVRTVRADRVFRGSVKPLEEGEDAWWIVDYKSAYEATEPAAVLLPRLRESFAGQLETYARILRALHGSELPVFAGIYYPRMKEFDWWMTGEPG